MRKRFVFIIMLFILIGVFLRFFHFDRAMYFMNDQGLLLLVAREIFVSHRLPLAGQPISFPGQVPPLTYYFIAFMMWIRSDPLAVSSMYITLNIVACSLLSWYSVLLFDLPTGIWTLALSMVSMAMIENSRSVWDPQPTFFGIATYLWLTEYAFRKRVYWLYACGVLMYMVSVALYPTPVLLLPFVFVRTLKHFRSWTVSLWFVGGIALAVFVPWFIQTSVIQTGMIRHMVAMGSLPVSPTRFLYTAYTYGSTALHDLFRIWGLLPAWLIGSVWMKLLGIGVSLYVLMSLKKINTYYLWIGVGLLVPAAVGMHMAPHRLLPWYPFFFVAFAWWIRHSAKGLRRCVAIGLVCLFVIGNGASWYITTVSYPRNEYPTAVHAIRLIRDDMHMRHIGISDVGVHYFRPDDQADYFAPPILYLLRTATQFPVSFDPLGNRLVRSTGETHRVVYLVCDGFSQEEKISRCIKPFLRQWPGYSPQMTYHVSSLEDVIVFVL